MVGRMVGRYRIVARLGDEGSASVWKAEDTLLRRVVALRLLPIDAHHRGEAADGDGQAVNGAEAAGETGAYGGANRGALPTEALGAVVEGQTDRTTVFDAGEDQGFFYVAMRLPAQEPEAAEVAPVTIQVHPRRVGHGMPEWENSEAAGPQTTTGAAIAGPPSISGPAVEGSRRRASRPWVRALVALLFGGLALAGAGLAVRSGAMRKLTGGGHSSYSSVAVLPLRNLGPEPSASEHLAEGLSQEFITKLTMVAGLRVTPWMTAQRYRESDRPIGEIAKELNVESLLVGTFQQADDRIRGTVSLVDGTSGAPLWSDRYEARLADLFETQAEIATAAAEKLRLSLTGEEIASLARPASHSLEAYLLYLKGEALVRREIEVAADDALSLFERAVALDPQLAVAYVGMAAVHNQRHFFGWHNASSGPAVAERSIRKALEIDPALVAARRALIHTLYERSAAAECIKEGGLLERSGREDVETLIGRAEAYLFGGQAGKAVPLLDRALKSDPANASALWFQVIANGFSGNNQRMTEAGEDYVRRFGENLEVSFCLMIGYRCVGRPVEARKWLEKCDARLPMGSATYHHARVAAMWLLVGERERAETIALDALEALDVQASRGPLSRRQRGVRRGLETLLASPDPVRLATARLDDMCLSDQDIQVQRD